MTRQSLTRIAAGAAVAGIVALAAAPAGALPHPFSSTSTTGANTGAPSPNSGTSTGPNGAPNAGGANPSALQFIQKAGDAAINARVKSLTNVVTDLGNKVPGCDVSALVTTAQSDIAALNMLETTLNQETTVAAAKADVQQIFMGFRVYALVIPVDEMVVASCRMSDVITKVQDLVKKLGSVNDPNIAALVSDMGTQATNAANAINGLPALLETYTPDKWNHDHGLLMTARQDLRTARKDLEQCRDDAHKVLVIVRHDLNLGGDGAGNGGANGGSPVNPNASPNT
ncbi:MAG TPA: hypothetical protein VMU14_19265, partial [Acidimicrobiales bacterium]|nr:hypothetical protein [Acidimicrobiales bacterium]